MSTIDQLSPAGPVSNSDLLMIDQNGTNYSITRPNLLAGAGLQPVITVPAGSLLGNSTSASGGPAAISVGANLTLSGGALSAQPFTVSTLPAGATPGAGDLVPVGQSNANAALSYAQFMGGLSGLAGIDASKLTVQPTGATQAIKLADLAATTVLTTGATMSGPLALAGNPTSSLQAAPKQYVDAQAATLLPRSGGALTGTLTLAADPTQPLQASTKQYVDARVQRSGDTMAGPLALAADPTQPLQASTKQYVDARVQRGGDTMAGPLALAADPTQPLQASTKQYVDTRVQRGGDTMTGPLALAADPTQPLQASTKQYVDTRVQRGGDTMTGLLTLAADPTQALHASTKQYVDGQAAALLSTGGGTLSGPVTLAGQGQNTIQNGSLYVGNSGNQYSVFNTSGPQTVAFGKSGSTTNDTNVVQSYYLVNHSGGRGRVINNLAISTAVSSTPADAIRGFLSALTCSAGGGNGGATGHVGGYLQTVRATVPIPASTLSSQASGTTVRVADTTNFGIGYTGGAGYPVSSAHPLPVLINGNPYSVVACAPDAAGASSGPGTLTLASAIAAADGAAGATVVGVVGGANLWGGVIEYHEQVDLPSSKSGFGQTLELDWVGNNSDDADSRCFVSAVLGKNTAGGTDVEVGNVLGVWPGNGATRTSGASVKRVLQVNVPFSQAIVDGRNATQKAGANAVWLADGQRIAFTADGTRTLAYDPATGAIAAGGPVRMNAPLTLANYTVNTLPPNPTPGSKVYASDGRKAGEASGTGTGVDVFADKLGRWISVLSGSPVQA